MEMCYDGALVMPGSYAIMDEEEMTYVEGGLYLNVDNCNKIAALCCAAVKLFAGAASAFFWYASANGGITVSWTGVHYGK